MSWTEAKIATLTRLWSEGVSAAGIAEALGDVSRSAVLGKLHRLKLLKSRKAAAEPRDFREAGRSAPAGSGPVSPATIGRRRRRPPGLPRSPWRAELLKPLPHSRPRPWLERGEGECAFPVGGEGWSLLACCAPAPSGDAYCTAHHQIMFRKPPAVAPRPQSAPAAAFPLITLTKRTAA
jgi:hypothetical protein